MFKPRLTTEYPKVKREKPERQHGRHVLNRYEDGMEKCIGCELCAGVCPAQVHLRARRRQPGRRSGLAGRALRLRLRDQLPALHPLRPVRRGVPDRGDHRDEALRVLVHEPRRRDLHQGRAARRRRRPRQADAVGAVGRRRGRPHERVDARDRAGRRRRVRGPGRLVGRAGIRRAPARAGPERPRPVAGRRRAALRRSRARATDAGARSSTCARSRCSPAPSASCSRTTRCTRRCSC